MPTIITKLLEQIDNNLSAGGLSAIACCQLTNAKTILNNNKVISVQSIADLPSASENTGRLIYIRNIGAYRFSDGISWRNNPYTITTIINRELWTWGSNNFGALGIGNSSTVARVSPIREFCSATDWCNLSFGVNANHSHAIKTSGQLWSWGNNANGQLGIGISILCICSPVREFCSATDWCRISSSSSSSSAVKNNGQIWSWGINSNGRLGDGTITTRCSPVREFCSATNWFQVSVGAYSVSALKNNGEIWTWGTNNSGQLGIGSSATIGRCSPVREFCSATDWCQVSTGYRHVAAIKTSGQLWSWGSNVDGGLGIGDSTTIGRCSPVREFCSATDWCQLSASSFSVMAINTSGKLWGWGCNVGSLATSCSPVEACCLSTEWACVSHLCVHGLALKFTKGGFSL